MAFLEKWVHGTLFEQTAYETLHTSHLKNEERFQPPLLAFIYSK
jgi:hypothetical protein